jgi:hypothetical protein
VSLTLIDQAQVSRYQRSGAIIDYDWHHKRLPLKRFFGPTYGHEGQLWRYGRRLVATCSGTDNLRPTQTANHRRYRQ